MSPDRQILRQNLDFLRRRRIHLLAQPNKTRTELDEIAKLDEAIKAAEAALEDGE